MNKFSHKGSFTKRNIDKIPVDKPIIYKIKNLAGENVYTGIAKKGRVPKRLGEHLPGSKDAIPGAKTFSIKQKLSIESAKREEKRVIKDENPKYNEQE
ncbi:unnamed protein product [marine sediment metagenome]|uniref:GIY-YIG domain-containing protein n=1 Tax=marine sediment metagenome TaxID=412755 RepID=X0XC83_9ZZZZ